MLVNQGGNIGYFMRVSLNKTRVFSMKFLLARRGSRKDFAQLPATVMDESWPSLAVKIVNLGLKGIPDEDILIFGVRNIHWGSMPVATSFWNMVKFLDLARRSTSDVMES